MPTPMDATTPDGCRSRRPRPHDHRVSRRLRRGGAPRAALVALALPALALALAAGCTEAPDPARLAQLAAGNLPPTTEIVNPRLQGEEATYNLLVSWRGHDEDGTIAGFEIAVDDTSAWHFTTAYDSLFEFESAACCVEDTSEAPEGRWDLDSLAYGVHSLFVRAIDNTGAEDATPDHITFTATNLFPETVILRGPHQIPGIDKSSTTVVLEWEGRDEDGVVSSFRYRLDEKPWVVVGPDCASVRFTNLAAAEFVGDVRGFHRFVVLSTDNAGAGERTLDPHLNIRRWESLREISGTIRIDSNIMGARFGMSTIEGEVFEGSRISFSWRADASSYGGVIQCYQFAYDQQEVFSGCDLGSLRYPPDGSTFAPTVGYHTLFVRAFDDVGQAINGAFPFVVVPGPIHLPRKRILLVDDFDEGGAWGGPLYPGDAQEDAFWDSVLVGYQRASFDGEANNRVPRIRELGNASTVIWYVDAGDTRLASATDSVLVWNPLVPYVNAGGNVILCGSLVTDHFTPDNTFDPKNVGMYQCPHQQRKTYGGPERSLNWFPARCDSTEHFVYRDFRIARSFAEILEGAKLKRLESLGPPTFPGLPDLGLDLTKRAPLGDGRPYFSVSGLEDCEQYLLRMPSAESGVAPVPLWAYVTTDGERKRPAAFYVPGSRAEARGNVVVLGFPPYYFDTLAMRRVFQTLLDAFDEPCTGPECEGD